MHTQLITTEEIPVFKVVHLVPPCSVSRGEFLEILHHTTLQFKIQKKINPPLRPCINISMVLVASFHCLIFCVIVCGCLFRRTPSFFKNLLCGHSEASAYLSDPLSHHSCPYSPTHSSEASEAPCPHLEGSLFAQWVAAPPQHWTQTLLSQEHLPTCSPTLLRAA